MIEALLMWLAIMAIGYQRFGELIITSRYSTRCQVFSALVPAGVIVVCLSFGLGIGLTRAAGRTGKVGFPELYLFKNSFLRNARKRNRSGKFEGLCIYCSFTLLLSVSTTNRTLLNTNGCTGCMPYIYSVPEKLTLNL